MTKRLLSSARLFTVEAANKTLPLVTAIVGDLIPLWQEIRVTRKRIKHLIGIHGVERGNPYSDELGAMEEKLARDSIRVEGYIDELREISVEFRGGKSSQAHICFPAMLDGRLVYLSWQLGESEVNHWIDLDGEFRDRQSLLAASAAE